MADFRRSIFAFIVVGLLLSFSTAVYAQNAPFTCQANAGVPPILRSEGLTELMGDIVMDCTGGTPTATGTTIPTANVTIFVNTAVTSRILNATTGASEALLTIDEPGVTPGVPMNLCGSLTGCNVPGRGGVSNPFATGANTYQGTVSGSTVTFVGVPVEPPGSINHTIYRITNVRVNASAIPASGTLPGQVTSLISFSGTTSLPLVNTSVTTGFTQRGLIFGPGSVRNPANNNSPFVFGALQCNGLGTGPARTPNAIVKFQEGFPTAWKPQFNPTSGSAQTQPGVIYNSESGLIPAVSSTISAGANAGNPANVTGAGVADFATRFKLTFNNIPAGVTIFVPTVLTSSTGLVATLTLSETLPFVPVTATNAFQGATNPNYAAVTLASGAGSAVWEITTVPATYAVTTDSLDAGLIFAFQSNPGQGVPALGTGTMVASFAPTYDLSVTPAAGRAQTSTFPIPRFVILDNPVNIINVTVCRTNILFPYLASVTGFDTGISIANTTSDIFGTAPQSGDCRVNFFGTGAPSQKTIPAIAAGKVGTLLGSTDFPNFQGYAIAQCDFQLAHGFAAISDLGARNWVTVYLALVIDQSSPRNGINSPAEALNQ